MGKKLFIGNLSFNTDDQSLAELFSQFGEVETARVVTDRDSGRSKGFGFVEMSSEAQATAAIDKLNGYDFSGRSLNVSEAKPMVPKEGRGNSRGFGGQARY